MQIWHLMVSTVEPDQVKTCVGIKPSKNLSLQFIHADFYNQSIRIKQPRFWVVLYLLMSLHKDHYH